MGCFVGPTSEGPGEHRSVAVGDEQRQATAFAQGAGDRGQRRLGVLDDLQHAVAQHQVGAARALAGRPDEAAHALTDPAGRWGPADGTARRWTLTTISDLVQGAGLVVEQVHGVRTVSDLVPSAVLDTEPGAAAALLALERTLSDRSPFRDLATQLHLLARKG
jgi:hypothetical protein